MGLICFFQDEQIDLLKKLRLFAIIVWCLCLFCCFVICLNSKKSVYRKFPRFVIWKKSSLAQSIYFLAILKTVNDAEETYHLDVFAGYWMGLLFTLSEISHFRLGFMTKGKSTYLFRYNYGYCTIIFQYYLQNGDCIPLVNAFSTCLKSSYIL